MMGGAAIERLVLAELHILRGATVHQLAKRLGIDTVLIQTVLTVTIASSAEVEVESGFYRLAPVRRVGMRVAS